MVGTQQRFKLNPGFARKVGYLRLNVYCIRRGSVYSKEQQPHERKIHLLQPRRMRLHLHYVHSCLISTLV
ncbi:hypothetical protein Mapa_005063 [Marchantia paleacea]|nr:hypothetical protein Mapa_005063 [Marchantia paleacea]